MSDNQSDALVFFGATGDLAYKKIFPSLQAMIKRGTLNVPVIGVAKAGWSLEQLKERARDSLEHHGGIDAAAFKKLMELLRYIDGGYEDVETFPRPRTKLVQGPAGPGHADDRYIEMAALYHGLQRWKYFLVGEIARSAEENQGVRLLSITHVEWPPCCAGFSS